MLQGIKLLFVLHKKLIAILFLSLAASQVLATDFPFGYIDKFIDQLAPHAKRYPPHFDSGEQRTEMVQTLKDVLGAMDAAPNKVKDDKEILFRYAFLNAMGHNLNVLGCSDKAINAYVTLLTLDPNDKRANYYFGTFLAGTKLISKSVSYLQKAIELGEQEAHYPLGFAYLSQKRNDDALAEFKKYLEYDPENATARQMVVEIEGGKLKLQFNYTE